MGIPLPHGWWLKNSSGSHAGPPPIQDEVPSDSGSDNDDDEADESINSEHGLDIRPDSPGWEDIEPDDDTSDAVKVQCLLCSESSFNSAQAMLDHCISSHSFNFVEQVKRLNLDFYSTIKYVNFIRSRVARGMVGEGGDGVEGWRAREWEGEEWLKPVLEGDALLFGLDEVVDFGGEGGKGDARVEGKEVGDRDGAGE